MKIVDRKLAGVLALLPWLALGPPAFSQNAETIGAPPLSAAQLAMLDVRASELIGKDVKNPQGEDLGRIEDLILDVANSHVCYVIIAYGGFLGLGNQLAVFPPTLFRPGPEKGELLLNVTRNDLEKAPGFDAGAWPDWNEESYRTRVDGFFFKEDELVRMPSGSRLTRVTDVIGKGVNDGGSRRIGSMEDLVVNLGNGQIRYAVLNYGGRWGLGGRLVPLPMNAFRFPTRPDLNIFLTLDRDRVAQARSFSEDNWPDLSAARERQEMEAYLSQFPQGGRPAAQEDTPAEASGASD